MTTALQDAADGLGTQVQPQGGSRSSGAGERWTSPSGTDARTATPALCLRSRMETMNVEAHRTDADLDLCDTLRFLAVEYPATFAQIRCGLGHMAAHWLTHHTITEQEQP